MMDVNLIIATENPNMVPTVQCWVVASLDENKQIDEYLWMDPEFNDPVPVRWVSINKCTEFSCRRDAILARDYLTKTIKDEWVKVLAILGTNACHIIQYPEDEE